MEAAGIEPASEKDPLATSTGLDRYLFLHHADPPIRMHNASFLQNLTSVPVSTNCRQPDTLTSHQLIRHRPDQRDHRSDQVLLLLTQRKRRRNRRWQLLCCRFLRGQRRLDLPLRLLQPRRNQCAPFLQSDCVMKSNSILFKKKQVNCRLKQL